LDQLSLPELPGLIAYSCGSVSDILNFLVIISFHNQVNISGTPSGKSIAGM
jgi:hypothetical protein